MMKLIVKAQVENESKDFSYNFDQPVVTLGRLKENDIQLPLSTVSGYHAQILQEGENYYLVDRGSINGTFLNAQKIPSGEKKLLTDGDVIRIQTFEIYFSSGVMMNIDQGATVQVARQMVMEVLGSWEAQSKEQPRLIVMGGPNNGKQIDLSEGKSIIIGRGSNCDIVIDHPSVSRRHAEVSFGWSGAFLKDLKSANGLFCNDQRVTGTQKLHDRDEIRPGQQTLSDPVHIVFSNPAEALLSKIEQSQETELAAKAAKKDEFRTHAESALPVQAPAAAPAVVDRPVQTPAPEQQQAPAASAAPVSQQQIPVAKKKNPLGAVAGSLVLLGIIAAIVWYFRSGGSPPVFSGVEPPQAASGETITITGKSLDSAGVTAAAILQRNAPILNIAENAIQLKIPVFAQMEPAQKQTEILLQTSKGTTAIPFTLLIAPQIKSVEPESGKPGTEVHVRYSGSSARPSVFFGNKEAKVSAVNGEDITCSVPEIPSGKGTGIKVPVKVMVNQVQNRNNFTFTVLALPSVEALDPNTGTPGQEVRIRTNQQITNPTVFFGDMQADVKSATSQEIVAVVPAPKMPIPPDGLRLAVAMKSTDGDVGGNMIFTIYPAEAKPPEVFKLSFFSKPYSENLGFNEYEVDSNIGPLLVLVGKDVYGSSNARADAVATNLNNAIPFFKSNSDATVRLVKEEDNALYAQAGSPENRRLLMHAYPDDALAYGKINGRVVSADDLAIWWQMLLDSYFKVFVQMRSPAETGILSAGGSILQNVFNFFSVASPAGEKYYRKDFFETMPADQRARLLALSFSVPPRLTSVEGKWSGTMTNILYSNISEPNLELVLTLRQSSDGTIQGKADLNWKVAMGGTEGGFQNVAYRKLGSYDISGVYNKTKSYPVEFSFTEKEQGRLNFVGRLEGNSMRGSYVISATGEQGSWTAKPR
jgi:pSer/pThr/pTyr-binding forkhead associated (FHA) protein